MSVRLQRGNMYRRGCATAVLNRLASDTQQEILVVAENIVNRGKGTAKLPTPRNTHAPIYFVFTNNTRTAVKILRHQESPFSSRILVFIGLPPWALPLHLIAFRIETARSRSHTCGEVAHKEALSSIRKHALCCLQRSSCRVCQTHNCPTHLHRDVRRGGGNVFSHGCRGKDPCGRNFDLLRVLTEVLERGEARVVGSVLFSEEE